jgi:hypothetical protein
MPFVEKMIVAININKSRLPLLFVTISTIVFSIRLKAVTGRMLSNSFISSCWKLGIGMKDQ